MNHLTIIGNLTRDPETRTTSTQKTVCSFTVAVNKRDQNPDFFRVSAWGKLGEICQSYLTKGRKVAVNGSVSLNQYNTQNGEARAEMVVMASDVEFLSPKEEPAYTPKEQKGFEEVTDEELTF